MTHPVRTNAWPLRDAARDRRSSFGRPFAARTMRLLPLLLLGACLGTASAAAQAPLTLVDAGTTVASITFEGADTFDDIVLREQIRLSSPPSGLGARVRRLFGEQFGVFPFDAVTLKKDVVRLRNHYQRNGFPRATVRDSVVLDTTQNAVGITFLIREGPILQIDAVTFGGPGGTAAVEQLPPELRSDWLRFTREIALQQGERLDELSLDRLRTEVVVWLKNRGYAFADAGAESFPDDSGLRTDVRLKILAGPRARVDEVRVLGTESVGEGIVRREMPFSVGDRYDFGELSEGQREVFGLGLFQLALVDPVPDQPRDSTVSVQIRVREGSKRTLEGFGGYFQEGGLTLRGRATHRNALGAARSLTATAEARTGLGGTVSTVDDRPITDLLASLAFRQPYVFDRRVSATLQPLVRRRDDRIEASEQAELSGSLLFTTAALRTAALTVTAQRRRLLSTADEIATLFEPSFLLQETGQSLDADALSVALTGTLGFVDDPIAPRRGVVVRPSARVAGGPLTTYSYARTRLSATGFVPLGRLGGVVRVTAGALRPLGDDSLADLDTYISLRDVAFFAGGTNDVRGWGEGQLGPKIVSLLFRADSLSTQGLIGSLLRDPACAALPPGEQPATGCPPDVTGTFGLGGQSKISGSVQVDVPLPNPSFGVNLFLDGGRVFQPARAYDGLFEGEALAPFRQIQEQEDAFRFGAGAGLQVLSPVGSISLALGFKLNPSYLDIRDPQAVADALRRLATGDMLDPFDTDVVPTSFIRRFQFHLLIGQSF